MRKRNPIPRYHFICLIILLAWTHCSIAMNLYVSPEGNDQWSGRLARPSADGTNGPLASLAGARDAIRRLKSQGPLTEPVRVIIADGIYNLREPFTLTYQDSGTETCPIRYEAAAGAKPVFTGGRVMTGFKRGENGQ